MDILPDPTRILLKSSRNGNDDDALYAVHRGRMCGIFETWQRTLPLVRDFDGAVYKKLKTRAEAKAWLEEQAARDRQARAPVRRPSAEPENKELPARGSASRPKARHSEAPRAKTEERASTTPGLERAGASNLNGSSIYTGKAREHSTSNGVIETARNGKDASEDNTGGDRARRYTAAEKGKAPMRSEAVVPSAPSPSSAHPSLRPAARKSMPASVKSDQPNITVAALQPRVPVPVPAASTTATEQRIIAYTDGAASNNQVAAIRIAGYGIHWAEGRPSNVPGDISRRCFERKTNNYSELLAIIRVLELTASDPRPLIILSDSTYSLNCFDWAVGWRRNGWKTSKGAIPKNIDMIRYMVALRALRAGATEVRHVQGHASEKASSRETPDERGNRIADTLATAGAQLSEQEAEADEDWVQLSEEAERRVEGREQKKLKESVQIDIGTALGLTDRDVIDGVTKSMDRMAIQKKASTTTSTTASTSPPRRPRPSREVIMAELQASQLAVSSTSTPTLPTVVPEPPAQSNNHTSASTSREPPSTTRVHNASAVRAHITPAAHTPAVKPRKPVVRIVEDEDYDEGIWEEEDTLEDEEMIAEALAA